jgi:hypothetical protein
MKMVHSDVVGNLYSKLDGLWIFHDYIEIALSRSGHWVLLDSAQIPAPSGKILIASAELQRRGRPSSLTIHVEGERR